MKKPLISVLYAAVLSLSLTACHDCDEPMAKPTNNPLLHFNAEGKAWLTLDFSLPKGSITRSVASDAVTRAVTFDDGEAAEYAVNSMTLVLFSGTTATTEDNLTVASTYPLAYTPTTDSHEQVTHHSRHTIQITDDNIRNSDRLYLLGIANASPSITAGQTFAQVKALTTAYKSGDYYVMSNAPIASATDGTGTVTTLVELDVSAFAPTEAEATRSAASVYLERCAAKVTVTTDNSLTLTIGGNTNIDFTTTDFQYAVDNYNATGYLVRHFSGDWLPYRSSATAGYRFTETVSLPTFPLRYRTYWAQDANYSTVPSDFASGSELTFTPHATYWSKNDADKAAFWQAMNTHAYCCENTFDVLRQQDDCTTSVLVRLQLNGGNNFYSTSVTGLDVIYQEPANSVTEEGTSANESFAPRRSTKVTSAKTIDEYLREWLMQTNSGLRNWVRTYAAGEPHHINIALTGDPLTGLATATVTQTARTSGDGVTAFAALNLNTYLSENIIIRYYKDGYCYYRVPIRHFTDTQTPWASAPAMTGNSTDQAYAYSTDGTAFSGTNDEKKVAREQAYLGRYGMVRNNWYNISITSVTHIGSPIIPPLTTDADDKVEQLLNATLSISGWEAHDQNL